MEIDAEKLLQMAGLLAYEKYLLTEQVILANKRVQELEQTCHNLESQDLEKTQTQS